jgi:serine/threonine protein kinase/tetratricopeptide (TPR) repeat protein
VQYLNEGNARAMGITAVKFCRRCGAAIPPESPQHSCGACLLETGLGLLADEPVAGVDSSAEAAYSAEAAAKAGSAKADDPGRDSPMLMDFGDYELLEQIGRGGQGVVFRARQKSLNRTVALKVIGLGQWATKAHLKRFRLEAEAAARLEHAGIVPIHEVGERDGSCYFSMKFVEGGQLDEVVRREPILIRRAVELVAKVARIVHYAHEHGILHRDIKPGNILLDTKGEPHLTDFGLARLVESESSVTQTLDVLGTPSYMAPEQAAGNNAAVSSNTDVYGLGAVLYQLLTGQPPFAGGTTYETIKLLLDTEPRQPRLLNPKIDRDLSTVCLKCLEKDPKRRYSSALALSKDLERWLKHEPIQARRTGIFSQGKKWIRRNPASALLAASLIALTAAAGWIIWKSELIRQPLTTGIAVLPFENLSEQKEQAAFADGVQDDILTKLAKIGDLKVISRTSVMEYRGKPNVRQIGDALRVSHVLEGSARRSGDRIHLNAQLIDTRTDTHVWAEEYDRDLNDLFAIQSEIAEKVAAALKAKLAPEEKARLDARPTTNSEAYVLYLTGLGREKAVNESTEDDIAAEQLYMQATALDPGFALAYARASILNSFISTAITSDNRTRNAKARTQAEEALRLSPNLGEAHMALGLCFYLGEKKYDAALKEFEVAAATSPNNAEIYIYVGGIYRRQGRWRESVASLERAMPLDPRNASIANLAGNSHLFVRDWAAAAACYTRAREINPDFVVAWIRLARLEVFRNVNPAAGRRILENVPVRLDSDGEVALTRWDMAMLERDYAAAENILRDLPVEKFHTRDAPKTYYQGRTALARGDKESAQHYFTTTIPALEKRVRDAPNDSQPHSLIGLLYAYLHRSEDAIREARRAVELDPESQDAFHGAMAAANLAMVYALVGEQESAITVIERLLSTPGPFLGPWTDLPSDITLADLRLRWEWDSLRSNPRFQKILAAPEPKTIY